MLNDDEMQHNAFPPSGIYETVKIFLRRAVVEMILNFI